VAVFLEDLDDVEDLDVELAALVAMVQFPAKGSGFGLALSHGERVAVQQPATCEIASR
jgi:hypothetical protein